MLLAVALVVVTIAAVTGAAWLLIPSVGLPAAVALGALVAPPDPVSVESVAGSVKIPRRLLNMLQSEGLFNDAVSIVVFQAAIGAVVAGHGFNAVVALQFLIGAAVAVAVGLAGGWLARLIVRFLHSSIGRTAITLVVPFAVYIAADSLHGSGVVAVVVVALEMRRKSSPQEADERVTSQAFWRVLELLVTGLAFGLVGLELRQVIVSVGNQIWSILPVAGIVCGAVVAVRAGWMTILMFANRLGSGKAPVSSGKDVVVLTWCGMRGLVTLALALALPANLADGSPFPARGEIIVIACAVLVVTLVVPGLSLRMLVRALRVTESTDARDEEMIAMSERAQNAALAALDNMALGSRLSQEQLDGARRELSDLGQKLSMAPEDENEGESVDDRDKVMTARAFALNAARRQVLEDLGEPGTDPEVADRVLRRLDLRTMLLDDARKTSPPTVDQA